MERALLLQLPDTIVPGPCGRVRLKKSQSLSTELLYEVRFLYVESGSLILVRENNESIESTVTVYSGFVVVLHKSDTVTSIRAHGSTELFFIDFGVKRPLVIDTSSFYSYRVLNEDALLDFFRQYIRESSEKSSCQEILVCLIHVLIAIATQAQADDENFKRPAVSAVVIATQVDACIAEYYPRPLDSAKIAHKLKYNVDYLERTYRQIRAMSITEAIHQRRVHEACALLAHEGSFLVKDIALLCGFPDSNSFVRIFKRIMDRTPSDFRDHYAQERPL